MSEQTGMIDFYIEQLREIGYSKDDARLIGQLLDVSAVHFSEMFGMEPEEYLRARFAGYSGMSRMQFRKKFDAFFKYESMEPEILGDREYLRDDFVHKPDHATVKVVKLDSNIAPIGSSTEITEWVMKILNDQGGNVKINTTGQIVEFVKGRVHDCVVKRPNPNRKGSNSHREAFIALRDMIAKAEYWKSRKADERHATRGDQDIYTSALNLNGILYSVIIKLDGHTDTTREAARKNNRILQDYYYKDHKLIKIEIAPALSETAYAYESEGFKPMAKATDTEAISKISLGILRGRVKPSLIEKNILFDRTETGQIRGAMRTLLDGRRMISLFENREASTVLHEMAHFWLEELRDAQEFSSCPEWARDLWRNLEDAYGFDMETVDNSKWARIQECFAIEFEDYCMEGVSPTPELRSAFSRFREWFANIHNHVLEFVGHDRIRAASRQVFDAILGCDMAESEKPACTPFKP